MKELYYWMRRTTVTGLYHDVKYGIINLFRWFYLVWNDRDWDWAFLAYMMSKKAKQMEKLQREYGISVEADKIADELKELHEALDFLVSDDLKDGITYKAHETMMREAQNKVGNLISGRMRGWWD